MKLLIILAFCCVLAYGISIPGLTLPKCQRNSPTLAECLLKSVEIIRPFLKTGIREINVPRLEPFKMRHLKLDAEIPGLTLKGDASNIVAYGGSEFQIENLKVDMDNYNIDVTVTIPKLDVSADYDCQGSKLFVLTINGSGQFKATFTDVTAIVTAHGRGVMKDGNEFLKIDDLKAHIRFGSGKLHVDPDNQSFKARTAAKFINTGSGKILKMIGPVIDKAAVPVIKRYLGKVLNVVPLNDVLTW